MKGLLHPPESVTQTNAAFIASIAATEPHYAELIAVATGMWCSVCHNTGEIVGLGAGVWVALDAWDGGDYAEMRDCPTCTTPTPATGRADGDAMTTTNQPGESGIEREGVRK